MEAQSQVKRTLGRPENLVRIREVLDENDGTLNRTALADQLCQELGFLDPRGELQRSACLKALRRLEAQGHFVLPDPVFAKTKKPEPKRLHHPVPAPTGVPPKVGRILSLQLVLVQSDEHRRIFNEMMHREHPRGAGPLVGRQLRYLIHSEHGWLGGLAFAAAALQLEPRDEWIGWDAATRRAQLHRIVGLSRLLIRPAVRCQNLASKVLSMCLRRLPEDFEARYGFRPLIVETFIDTQQFDGACFRAANWQRIGQTRGRGRQDRERAMAESVKDIYLYPLEHSFREMMSLPPRQEKRALALDEGLDNDTWAEAEFGGAPLGDTRRTARLVFSARLAAQQPGRAFCAVAKGDWPAVKGYYRFIDESDESAVTSDNILLPHRERTVLRMKGQETVLCIQDGTDLDYSGLDQCKGLGVIGTNQTGAKSGGLHLHSTLAVTTEGIPLGVLRAECTAPQPKVKEDERPSSAIPIEEKKTFTWIQGLRDCQEIAAQIPETRLIAVLDREADFFELFDEQRTNTSVALLVRAKHNRGTTGDAKLFDAVGQAPVARQLRLHVRRQSGRPKKSKQKARSKTPDRVADVALRFARVELRPPSHLHNRPPITVSIIEVREDNPPEGVEPLCWRLLTTEEITSADQAEEYVRWYCLRWRIEDWHRVLKTGCRVESTAHENATRLTRALAIDLVIGWRIMLMTLLGREQPNLPADVLFTDLEIEVLEAFEKKPR